jgi:16S rRNA processing protein RimM
VRAEIQIPASERRSLAPGKVYLSDLIGCAVIENGFVLGTVKSVEHTGAAPLLNVGVGDGELLIPFAEEICTNIDLQQRQIQVQLPEGLKELNQGRS